MSDNELTLALDRFDVPPLSAGFADRVVGAAETRVPAGSPWPSRAGRGGWGRRATIVGGGVAFGLLSAAAAATGYLGEPVREAVREAPVIGPIIARVDPPRPKPVAKPVSVATPKPARPTAPEKAAAPTVQQRREAMVADVRQRMERRREERAALGLPPQRPRVALRQAIREMPPEERRELIREYRQGRREWFAERWRLRQERRTRWLEEQRRAEADLSAPDEGQADLAR